MPDFPTNQIYPLVNDVAGQAMGTLPFKVVDGASLVSLGDLITNTNNLSYAEGFINTLSMRIGKTIYSFRAYTNKLGDVVLNDYEYGAILQKIKVSMPSATQEFSIPLEDGTEVNPWKVSLPEATQKLFYKRTPYTFYRTIQLEWLREAFLNAGAMSAFVSMIFGETRNKIELALENLGRTAHNNMIAETSTSADRVVNLVTDYNTLAGLTGDAALTGGLNGTAVRDADFMRYAISVINTWRDTFTDMSVKNNDGTETRHTPYDLQRMYFNSRFIRVMETLPMYNWLADKNAALRNYKTLNFWQAEGSPTAIDITRASDSKEIAVNNIIATLSDRDAWGIYQFNETVASTPMNAAALFTTTYWHERQLWFNDTSENFVYFTLN